MGIEDGAVDGASERASEADTRYGGGYGSVPVSPRSENGERLRWEGRGSVMRIGTRKKKGIRASMGTRREGFGTGMVQPSVCEAFRDQVRPTLQRLDAVTTTPLYVLCGWYTAPAHCCDRVPLAL
jgi:hypothetical protein